MRSAAPVSAARVAHVITACASAEALQSDPSAALSIYGAATDQDPSMKPAEETAPTASRIRRPIRTNWSGSDRSEVPISDGSKRFEGLVICARSFR
jgi:hypothetical protein